MASNLIETKLEALETGLDAINHIIQNRYSLNIRLYITESYTDLQKACRYAGISFEPIELELERLNFDKDNHLKMFNLLKMLNDERKNHVDIVTAYYNLRHSMYKAHYYFKPVNSHRFVIYDKLTPTHQGRIDTFQDYVDSLILLDDLLAIQKHLKLEFIRTKRHGTASIA